MGRTRLKGGGQGGHVEHTREKEVRVVVVRKKTKNKKKPVETSAKKSEKLFHTYPS